MQNGRNPAAMSRSRRRTGASRSSPALAAATQANLATLRSRGVHVVGPGDGPMAEDESGPGRLVLTRLDEEGEELGELAGLVWIPAAELIPLEKAVCHA